MKKLFGLLLTLILVLTLFACGSSEPEDTTPITYTAGTYAMESYTKNGESLGEEVLAMYADSRYVLKEDGTCVYTVNINGTQTHTPGVYTIRGQKLTMTLDFGQEGKIEMIFTFLEDTFTFTETVGQDAYVQTYRKQN